VALAITKNSARRMKRLAGAPCCEGGKQHALEVVRVPHRGASLPQVKSSIGRASQVFYI
jgi:hypothetical protein